MTNFARYSIAAALATATAACQQGVNPPMLFVQTESVGITINTGATQTSPELTVGYRDVDAALVPVSLETSNGTYGALHSHAWESNAPAATFTGAISGSTLTASSVVGRIATGETLFGASVKAGTTITATGTGTGGDGTYIVSAAGTVPSTTMASGNGQAVESDDALSVLGQFQVNVKSATPCVGLGKFFATGLAAKKLADGFSASIRSDSAAKAATECAAAQAKAQGQQ